MSEPNNLTYKDAGVDIDAGNALVENIKPLVKQTSRQGVLGSIGGFGGLFELPTGYEKPILVSGTDGVGTKLKLAIDTNIHSTIGIDLVAMCVNDIVVTGAEPLYFLDYYATGQLNVEQATSVIEGISEGCIQAGCALIGGETAEMPGMYQPQDYDLAGFSVGIVEKDKIITGEDIKPSDVILGLGASGPHSNGYSLIRKTLERAQSQSNEPICLSDGTPIEVALLAPTRIYVKSLLELNKKFKVKGLAHITGGGITENLPRIFSNNIQANIDLNAWQLPEVFQWIQETGQVTDEEMLKTFNCGIGMMVVLSKEVADSAIAILESMGEKVFKVGTIQSKSDGPSVLYSNELS